MNTLVISDLHLGAHGGRALLHSPEVRAALAAKLVGVDRLVLLGDVVELREEPVWDSLSNALAVLGPLTDALGPHAEIIITAGNHDHQVLAQWMLRRGANGTPEPLGLESAVDWRQGDPLGRVVDAWGAGGAAVRVAYPGIWLRDDVYAMHGHYLDRHTTIPAFERLAAGAMARYLKEPTKSATRAEDYEAVLAPIYAWMFEVAQSGHAAEADGLEPGSSKNNASARIWKLFNDGEGITKLALSGGLTAATGLLQVAGLGPLKSDISADEVYRSSVRGAAGVVDALGIDADYVIYGHTHRAGPLPSDEADLWVTGSGTRLINTGCWVTEEAFVGPEIAQTASRPGFAVRLGDSGPPELVNLLERGGSFSV